MRDITQILCLSLLVFVRKGTADFITSVNTPVNNPTIQQVVAMSTTSFLKALDLERAKSNSILNAVQYIESGLENIQLNNGKDLVSDFFLEGTAGIENLNEYLRDFDSFSADIIINGLRSWPDEAKKVYVACFMKKVNSTFVSGIVNGVKDIISKGLSAESNFTVAASKCIQGQRDKLDACLANASYNLLPIVAENIINAKSLATIAYECISKAAEKLRALGNLTYKAMGIVVIDKLRFNLPLKYEPIEKVFSVISDFVYPTSAISEVPPLLAKAKKEVKEALNGRTASVSFVKAYLQPLANDALAVLDKIKVDTSASFCITNAKQAVADNVNSRVQEIIQRNLAYPAPPSEKEVTDVEKAFFEKKVTEGLLYSWAQCVMGKSWNIFYQNRLDCCIQESQSDYGYFLDGIKVSLANFIRRSIYVKALINQSAVYGERAFKKQLDTDLLTLERCMKKNTKLPIAPSMLNFV